MREVKRYCLSEFAEPHTYPVGPGSYVATEDYDALRAEAEALQRQVTELTNQRDAILLQARCWAGEAKAQQAITKAVCEALGGVPDWGPIAAGVEALRAENERLQRTVDEHLIANHKEFQRCERMRAELEALRSQHAELQEAFPLFTCTGKGGEYAKLGYAKPAGAIKTIQGEGGLIVYRDTQSGQLYFRDPGDFRDRMSPLSVMEPCDLGGEVVRQRTAADTSPPPAQEDPVMSVSNERSREIAKRGRDAIVGADQGEREEDVVTLQRAGHPELVSYAEDMSTCTLTCGDGIGYFYNRVTDAEIDSPPAQDVRALVEALMSCTKAKSAAEVGLIVDEALSCHRQAQRKGDQP